MKQAVLLGIYKCYSDKIYSGEKPLEIRNRMPFRNKNVQWPITVYMYETKGSGGSGLVTGEFLCDKVIEVKDLESIVKPSCVSLEKLQAYSKGKTLYGWHVLSARRYNEPVPLSFLGVSNVPQGWQYVNKFSWEENL